MLRFTLCTPRQLFKPRVRFVGGWVYIVFFVTWSYRFGWKARSWGWASPSFNNEKRQIVASVVHHTNAAFPFPIAWKSIVIIWLCDSELRFRLGICYTVLSLGFPSLGAVWDPFNWFFLSRLALLNDMAQLDRDSCAKKNIYPNLSKLG